MRRARAALSSAGATSDFITRADACAGVDPRMPTAGKGCTERGLLESVLGKGVHPLMIAVPHERGNGLGLAIPPRPRRLWKRAEHTFSFKMQIQQTLSQPQPGNPESDSFISAHHEAQEMWRMWPSAYRGGCSGATERGRSHATRFLSALVPPPPAPICVHSRRPILSFESQISRPSSLISPSPGDDLHA